MSNNWFTILLSSNSRQPEAAYNLLSSGTVPPLDMDGTWDGKPLIGWLARRYNDMYYWTNLGNIGDRDYYQIKWIYPGEPLPLSSSQPRSNTVSFPTPMEKQSYGSQSSPQLEIYDALFARLLELGADPWVSWQEESGPVDGFDLALASGCVPLVQACLAHKNRPPLEDLYKRNPWALMGTLSPNNRDITKPFFSAKDTLVHAAAAAGKDQLLELLIDNGWPVNAKGKFFPLSVVQTTQGLELLFEAGAKWNDEFLKHWQAWAKRFPSHEKSLADRIEAVRKRNLGASGDQILSQKAIEAFRKSDTSLLDKVLLSARKSSLGADQDNGKDELTYEQKNAEKRLGWAALPDVPAPKIFPSHLKKATPLLVIASGVFVNLSRPKRELAKSQICGYAAEAPESELAPGLSTLGMSQLVYAFCYKLNANNSRSTSSYVVSKWMDYINQMDKAELIGKTRAAFEFMVSTEDERVIENATIAMTATLNTFAQAKTMDALDGFVDLVLQLGVEQQKYQVISTWLKDKPIETRLSWTRVLADLCKDDNDYSTNYWKEDAAKVFRENIEAIKNHSFDSKNEKHVQAMGDLLTHLDTKFALDDEVREISSQLKMFGLSATPVFRDEPQGNKPKM